MKKFILAFGIIIIIIFTIVLLKSLGTLSNEAPKILTEKYYNNTVN